MAPIIINYHSMKVLAVVLLLTLAVIFSGCQGLQKQSDVDSSSSVEDSDVSVESAPAPAVSDSATDVSGDVAESADVSEAAVYENYSEALYNELLGKKPFALFFHAPWCGTCGIVEKDILSNISDFPVGAVILKVDYDTEKALEAKYGVTSQSLIVVIGADGQAKETLVAPEADELAAAFEKLL